MNPTIETILNRRSVREYSEKQLNEEDLKLIIKAGSYAPSASNFQSWHFTVVQDKKIMDIISEEAKKELLKTGHEMFRNVASNKEFDLFYGAPTIIIVSGESEAPVPHLDCAAATQNILLAAESLDIGSCWIGFATFLFMSKRGKEFTKLLEIPEGYEPYYAITLGYKKYPNLTSQPRRGNTVNYIK